MRINAKKIIFGVLVIGLAIVLVKGIGFFLPAKVARAQPETIITCQELQDIGLNPTTLAGSYILGDDIDCSATSGWDGGDGFDPIGDSVDKFTGTYNGNNYTIINLTINRPGENFVGLFGYTYPGVVISNVGLVDVDIIGNTWVGGLVGSNWDGDISNSYSRGSVSGNRSVGGLVGRNYGDISSSYSSGGVTGTGDYIGGLVGYNDGGSISNSYTTGNVFGAGDDVGGLVGYSDGTISNSYSTGNVTGTGSYIGGFIGYDDSGGYVANFWDTETSGQSVGIGNTTSPEVTGKITQEMMQETTFTGWDFTVVGDGTIGNWIMAGYPHLQMEHTTTVTNIAELQLMAVDLTASYTLANNIIADGSDANHPDYNTAIWNYDVSDYLGFDPVGKSSPYFTGSFDGDNHTITNLTINRPGDDEDQVGLFGYTTSSAVISNVGLVDCNITGYGLVGGLVGYNFYGVISNSYFSGSVIGIQWVGGLIGRNYGTISNSYSIGSVTGTGHYVGGLIGENHRDISNSYSTSGVIGTHDYVGGLVGASDNVINNSYSTGSVTGDDYIGGLVGVNTGAINNSYSTGSVTGDDYIGGLVGINLVNISNSYSTGSVNGISNVGGFVGFDGGGNYTSNFWDINTSDQSVGIGNTTSPEVTGKTTQEMIQQATFEDPPANWDFTVTPIWKIFIGPNSYPCLMWQEYPTCIFPTIAVGNFLMGMPF